MEMEGDMDGQRLKEIEERIKKADSGFSLGRACLQDYRECRELVAEVRRVRVIAQHGMDLMKGYD